MLQTLKFITPIRIINKQNQYKFQQRIYCHKSHSSATIKSESENTIDIRLNFHQECEEGLNKQINLELQASYTYFCMSTCLSRPDVALPGFAQFFTAAGAEERHHAQLLTTFVNMRGGTVDLRDIPAPTQGPFHDPVLALQHSIKMEQMILTSLEELHKIASTHENSHLTDFLESHFIGEGYEGIRQLAEMLTRLKRAGPGVGAILLDIDLLRHPQNMHGLSNGK